MEMAAPSATEGSGPTASYRPIVAGLVRDIVLNATIPVACYSLSKRFASPSEVTALIAATVFPVLKSVHDLVRHRHLDPIAVIVLLGIGTGMVGLFLSGDPHLLLIRESLFGGVLGFACLVSLLLTRPLMFYFGRYFLAGRDPERRRAFDDRWQYPLFRRSQRLITTVWGLVFVGEFVVRVALVYSVPAPVVLAVSPFLTGGATIATTVWTFRYVFKLHQRFGQA